MILRPVLCRRFVGRREELEFLEEKRRDAARSRGSLVLVSGEAGIGKSRLLSEFCGRLGTSRLRVGRGSCLEHARRPYGPVLEVLARLDPLGDALPAVNSSREQIDSIVARFASLSAKTGLIAIVEDIHWADHATLELLAALAPHLHRMRVLVLATFRTDRVSAREASFAALERVGRGARTARIVLTPLGDSELSMLIDDALGERRLPVPVRRTVARASEGNPFFAEELLRAAVDRSSNGVSGSSGFVALPSSVSATLLERWHPLPPDVRRVVSHAAVIGRTFDVGMLATFVERDEATVLRALAAAREAQLVDEVSAATFRFRHALLRDAIYGDFLGAEAAALHRRLARVLASSAEPTGSLEALAYHTLAAGEQSDAVHYNELAGDAAARIHAHDNALVYYQRALDASPQPTVKRARIFEKIADRHVATGATEGSLEAIESAASEYHSVAAFEDEARCRARHAIIAYTLHKRDPASPLEAMLASLDPSESLALARVRLGLAWLSASFGYPTDAAAYLARIDGRTLAVRADVALRFHNVAAWVAMTIGDLETFRHESDAWIEASRSGAFGALCSAHSNSAFCYALFGRHNDAAEHVARALDAAREERSLHGEAGTHAIAVGCAFLRGDLPAARAALARVSPMSENQVTLCHAAGWGTLTALHLGDDALIETWFDGLGESFLEGAEEICGAAFAEILVRRGRTRDAERVLHRTIAVTERQRGNVMTLLAAARFAAPEDADRARAQLVAADAPNELVERHALALFDAYAAVRAGNTKAAEPLARRAAEGFGRLGFPLLEAVAREACGDVDRARELYRACGAVGDLRRLERVAHIGSVRATSGRSAAAGAALSKRERQVVTLVANGSSNKAVAERLDISVKTVEKHLGAAYRKIGITSRSRLVDHLVESDAG